MVGTDFDPKPRLRDRYPGQVSILHNCPDDGQTTGFYGEGITVISVLANIAKEAFNSVGTPTFHTTAVLSISSIFGSP